MIHLQKSDHVHAIALTTCESSSGTNPKLVCAYTRVSHIIQVHPVLPSTNVTCPSASGVNYPRLPVSCTEVGLGINSAAAANCPSHTLPSPSISLYLTLSCSLSLSHYQPASCWFHRYLCPNLIHPTQCPLPHRKELFIVITWCLPVESQSPPNLHPSINLILHYRIHRASLSPLAAINLSQQILKAQQQTINLCYKYEHFTTTYHPHAVDDLQDRILGSINYIPPAGHHILWPNDLMCNSKGNVVGRYLGIEGRYGEYLILWVLIISFEFNPQIEMLNSMLKFVGAHAVPGTVQDTPPVSPIRHFDEELTPCGDVMYNPASVFSCISLWPYIRLW